MRKKAAGRGKARLAPTSAKRLSARTMGLLSDTTVMAFGC
jgi:hypothetical protein